MPIAAKHVLTCANTQLPFLNRPALAAQLVGGYAAV
jgi:hypothetical protein